MAGGFCLALSLNWLRSIDRYPLTSCQGYAIILSTVSVLCSAAGAAGGCVMTERVVVCGFCGSMDTIDGLSVCEQCVEEDMAWSEREVMPDYRDPFGRALHHPDCCCDVCYYGEDAARWLFHPAEY